MSWQQILERCRAIKEAFDRSYKCLNLDRPTSQTTIDKHITILTECLEQIRTILNVHYERFTQPHKIAAEAFFDDIRGKVIQIANKKNIDIKVPETIQTGTDTKTRLQTEDLEILDSLNMAEEILNTTELASISKLLTVFNGNKEELNSFIANLEILRDTLPENKRNSFFNFVYKTKLTNKVQTRLRQIQTPTNVDTLILTLKEAYKIKKSPNVILNELTSITQIDTIRKFADKIESLTMELNEIQISTLGEEHRDIISKTNAAVAFNSFKNGLKNKEISRTIEASRVKKLNEAIEIAIETSTDIRQSQIMFQANNRENNFRGNRNNNRNTNRKNWNNNRYNNNNNNWNTSNGNGSNQQNRNGCNNKGNYRRNHDRNNDRNFNKNNNNYRNNNNTNNYNNYRRNRTVNHMNDQGNYQGPEVVNHHRSPEQEQEQ